MIAALFSVNFILQRLHNYTGDYFTRITMGYCLYSLICIWLVFLGGAQMLEGRRILWFTQLDTDMSAEEIRSYTVFCWIGISLLYALAATAQILYG
ncbi:Uncharacterised protein [Kingella potus]|uniref:Uncharacterized protein n=1 Tax=Kingella potus TaxID=265175 RepID=A0A377QYZ8_9NEIS|nr:hypothetical protein [Kingella potus]UOP00926.1 hypothetical protein LVJ84_00445 [Kingella potus]STR00586.1 Uncharacterised protein [Kingella potus]